MQLLAVGKSIRNIQDKPNSYKMSSQRLLPTFGNSKRNVFAATPETAKNQGVSGEATDAPSSADTPAASATTRSASGWWPFKRSSAGPRKVQQAQAQLELGTVRPLRNELIDTDLEIIIRARQQPNNPFTARLKDEKTGGGSWVVRLAKKVLRR